ncbi:hypothetical protein ACDX66_01785 [Peribacillus frigoritolerans]
MVSERNLFQVPAEEIPDIKVLLTIVECKVVFDHTTSLIEK